MALGFAYAWGVWKSPIDGGLMLVVSMCPQVMSPHAQVVPLGTLWHKSVLLVRALHQAGLVTSSQIMTFSFTRSKQHPHCLVVSLHHKFQWVPHECCGFIRDSPPLAISGALSSPNVFRHVDV
ncbi:Uncharacterized protein TCM_017338 [Theobroma cacao]|uniref:Uncharacterized protein n=1 Tax=Theobroma cacao TaxID=3641 RepID=A0A061EEV9_THECC|nr:Uncharacterized protein TCM_017338 [Theobroma cacao]